MVYRCPVDDTVFQTFRIDRIPTTQGHPECPGPECRKRFGGTSDAGETVKPVSSIVVPQAAAPLAPVVPGASLPPAPVGQDW
jgi:hypothetical protein